MWYAARRLLNSSRENSTLHALLTHDRPKHFSVQLPCPRCLTAGISQVPDSQAPGTTVRNVGEGTVEREDFGQDAVDPTGSAQGCCGVPVHEAMHGTWRDVECWLREDSHQVGPFNCSRPRRIVPRAHVEARHSALPKCVTASGKGRRKPCRSCRALVHSAGCPCCGFWSSGPWFCALRRLPRWN